ncbi:heterokaryon incompatibility protein-domain-containing protein [Clohesyomyces aquaticus]|uniref:Heterokaryon incompatibility protein-domain-containing protein n=1 Tax=Clohesyomyces aquaticus TaxID=1231657 RepID=A0A1Y1YXG9_9PLEO|nr:heterokaryon incompatibility protein-domain-containing protein [Clohesyomyces aquaticus]
MARSQGSEDSLLMESPQDAPQYLLELESPSWSNLDRFGPRSSHIDIVKVREWSNSCASEHSRACLGPRILLPQHTMTVIDVESDCLVELPHDSRYMALSYVWGAQAGAQARQKRMESLKTPGSLPGPSKVLSLPATVRDTIHLASKLGIKYLWVDRLCIIQDNEEYKKKQLSQMAAIYENAFITVIAVDGERADHGLRGIGLSSQMRQYRPRMFEFSPDLCLLSSNFEEEEKSYLHKWHMRAWTFQERAISRQKLIFVNGTV